MSSLRRPGRLLAATAVLSLAVAGLTATAPPASAAAPPALSNLRYAAQRDHYLQATFDVPAAFYSPGAYVVARLTRGWTPAASPTAGYPLEVSYKTVGPPVDPPLTADTIYTFAMWLHTSGGFSKRAYVNLKTRKDVTPPEVPEELEGETRLDGFGQARILIAWRDCCDDIASAQIARNTRNSLTGASVATVTGTRAWIDDYLPDSVRPGGGFSGFSTTPLYYFVRLRDRAGYYSSWSGVQVVPGDHTLHGHVAGGGTRSFTVVCCPSAISGRSAIVAQVTTDAAGDFVVHLPTGLYGVCAGDPDTSQCTPADLRASTSVTVQLT